MLQVWSAVTATFAEINPAPKPLGTEQHDPDLRSARSALAGKDNGLTGDDGITARG